jgi:mRNA interferase HigB
MRIISRSTLRDFWLRHADAKGGLEAWFARAKRADWTCMGDVVRDIPSADPVGPKHLVFNVCGNSYRLVCTVSFPAKTLFVKFVGTHPEYDRINVKEL